MMLARLSTVVAVLSFFTVFSEVSGTRINRHVVKRMSKDTDLAPVEKRDLVSDLLNGRLLNVDILRKQGGPALINLGVVANLLGTGNCSSNALVSIKGGIVNLLGINLLSTCACVNILPNGEPPKSACAACPGNSTAICGGTTAGATCGCQCAEGFYADVSGVCVPEENCAPPNLLTITPTGRATCGCARGFVSDLLGGCTSVCVNI